MTQGNRIARPERALRSILVAVLTMILTGLALLGAVPSAQAASSSTLKGTGSGSSKSVKLTPGLYRFVIKYSDNTDEWGDATDFEASLESKDDGLELLSEYESANRVTRIVHVFQSASCWIDVDTDADAPWTVAIKKLSQPSKVTKNDKISERGTKASSLYRLKAGLYTATITYSDNRDGWGTATNFATQVRSYNDPWNDEWVVDTYRTKGTVTRTVRVPKSGIYWFQTFAGAEANWTLKFSPKKKSLTRTPKPTISGTAKVGKKLKAVAGTWKPSGVKLTYQWYRNSAKIIGATRSTYTLKANSKGKNIQVKVTGKKAGYSTVTRTSKATRTVK